MKKTALIYGITGQDGSYLSEFLIKKNYVVHGVKRRSSSINTERINHLYQDPHEKNKNFILHYGDVTDTISVKNTIEKIKPDEIYNLAAQSHVGVSFQIPEYTANVDALGTLRILESIRSLNLKKKVKFYQAGTSEMFGKTVTKYQNEKTNFYPRSPYAASKVYAHWITVNYRESYNIFACNGILFNHESPVRGETFVTKKIVSGLYKIKNKKLKTLYLGNIYSKRDWGHARDYVEAMWKILHHKQPDDFLIATGQQYTVQPFIHLTCKELNLQIKWKGKGLNETALDKNGKAVIKIDKNYFRPSEVDSLLGDSSKAKKVLNWRPKINLKQLIKEMIINEHKNN